MGFLELRQATGVYSRVTAGMSIRNSRLFLGTLWSSIKQIKSSFVLNWEHGIAEHAMQGNCASSLAEGEDS